MTPLGILQIHNHYREQGGEDTVVAKDAELLRYAGHEVFEYQVSNPTNSTMAATSLLAAPWNLSAANVLRRTVEQIRPDVAHVHNTWWSLSPSILKTLDKLNIPVVVTLHNYRLMCVNAQLFRDGAPCEDCVGSHPWRGVQHRCYRDSAVASAISAVTIQLSRKLRIWESVDRLLVLTEFAKSRFVSAGVPSERLHVKPNFVEDPGPRTMSPSDSETVLFVGRLSPEKGVSNLLTAWAHADTGDLELALVGDGPLRAEWESRRIPNVSFTGRLPSIEVRKLMLSSRALVFPSVWYEGQPMVLLEAMGAGLPLVVSDVGSITETVAGNRTAALVRPGDTSSWTSALSRVTQSDWLEKTGASARSLFEERYTPEIGLAGLLYQYEAAMANRRS
jgi:glycosyltransferase involved in cell wall biosynthesis